MTYNLYSYNLKRRGLDSLEFFTFVIVLTYLDYLVPFIWIKMFQVKKNQVSNFLLKVYLDILCKHF